MSIFPTAVFLLCLVTSLLCAVLLLRQYRRTRNRLLFWSAICFCGLTLNNLFVVCDLILFPNIDFLPYRHGASLLAIGVLLYGFIWETD